MSTTVDLPIETPSGHTLLARLTRPDAGVVDHRCAVLQIHGGGWHLGVPAMLARRSQELAGRGFTAIAIAYRLVPEAPWPAQLHDVKCAIRHVRANAASLGVDPDRIVLEGHSAGGHLALLAAGTADRPEWDGGGAHADTSSAVAAVVAFYPPTDLRNGGAASRLLGDRASAQDTAAASPITHVHPAFPPTMLLHGTADAMVPHSSSEAMHAALQHAGVYSELHLYGGQIHEFDAAATMCALTQHEAATFFERTVIDPGRFDAEQAADNPLWGR